MADTAPQKDDTAPVVDRDPYTIDEDGPTLPQILRSGFVDEFEKGVEVYKRWLGACFKLTRENHWINQSTKDKPRYFLQGPGAEALMNPLGISYEEPKTRCEALDNGGYAYWVEGYMESRTLRRRGYYVGYCDSRDQFFNARPGWKPETGHGDVRKAATTNWTVNAVTRLAGIRDPDPQLLKKAGLDTDRITQVDYRGGKTPEESNAPISEPQAKRLWALAKQAGMDEKKLHDFVAREPWKYESLKDIKRSHYDAICTGVQNYKPEEKKENGGSQEAK